MGNRSKTQPVDLNWREQPRHSSSRAVPKSWSISPHKRRSSRQHEIAPRKPYEDQSPIRQWLEDLSNYFLGLGHSTSPID